MKKTKFKEEQIIKVLKRVESISADPESRSLSKKAERVCFVELENTSGYTVFGNGFLGNNSSGGPNLYLGKLGLITTKQKILRHQVI